MANDHVKEGTHWNQIKTINGSMFAEEVLCTNFLFENYDKFIIISKYKESMKKSLFMKLNKKKINYIFNIN